MKLNLEAILDECLTLMANGASLEDCLKKYPEQAQELAHLLQMARKVNGLRPAEPLPAAAVEAQKQRFLDKARRLKQEKAMAPSFGWLNWGRLALPARLALATAAVLALAVLVGGGAVLASGQDLGDVVVNLMPQPVRDFFGIETVPEMTPTPEVEEELPVPLGEPVAELRGSLSSLTAATASVCAVQFQVAPNSEIEGSPQPGDPVKVEFAVGPDGEFLAIKIEIEEQPEECELRVEGTLEVLGDTIGSQPWVVEGILIFVNAATEVRGTPQVGDLVKVRAAVDAEGNFFALRIEEEGAEEGEEDEQDDGENADDEDSDEGEEGEEDGEEDFQGSVEEIGEGFLVIEGITFFLGPDTKIEDTLEVGLVVRVRYVVQEDGSFLATRIEVRESED